ncbi:response regulator transcription factor [Myxococcota bacterium]|nr:response regulator transcription factor [Myxococcota bacterium]
MAHVLVADDDPPIRDVLRYALLRAGHTVVEAADGREAWTAFQQAKPRFDAVLLDIVMPELDGLEVCRRIRAAHDTPILFLSSRDEELDRILGLELGADDYVTKPFSPREVVTRLKVVLRRVMRPQGGGAEGGAPGVADDALAIVRGPLRLETLTHRCFWQERELVLTVSEFELLRVLLTSPGRVFSRDALTDHAFGADHHISDRTIDSHIRRLRRKFAELGASPIETVYGVGYRLGVP